MKNILIYTDGACQGNPGPGGWAAIIIYGAHVKEISGFEPATTNNRMELEAAVQALGKVKEPCSIEFFTDSEYLRNGITNYIRLWKRTGWKTKEKKEVKNRDLWMLLDHRTIGHQIAWHWLKGHAGHPKNERCDVLARQEIEKLKKKHTPDELKKFLQDFKMGYHNIAGVGPKSPSLTPAPKTLPGNLSL